MIQLGAGREVEVIVPIGAVACCRLGRRVVTFSDQRKGVGHAVGFAEGCGLLIASAPFVIADVVLGDDQVVRRYFAACCNQAAVVTALAGPVFAEGRNSNWRNRLNICRRWQCLGQKASH